MNLLFILLSGVVGLVLGILVMFGISKAGLNKDQQKAAQILEQADIQADAKVKQAILDGRTQVHELKIEAEKEIKERRQEITEMENKLLRREDNLNFRDETLAAKEKQIDRKSTQLSEKLASLDEKEKELQAKIDVQITELERVAAMSSTEAKEELFAAVEKRMEQETVAYIKDKEEEAKAKLEQQQKLAQMEAEKEEEKEEEVEQIEIEEVKPEAPQLATQLMTELLLTDTPKEDNEIKANADIQKDNSVMSTFTQAGSDDIDLIKEHKEEVVQEKPREEKKKEEVFTHVEQMPKFPGGDAELYKFISNNLNYPAMAIENNVQGRVVVQFVVTKDGSIGNVKVVRSVDRDLDNEAIRVCKKLPKFIPGKQNGQPVNVWYTLPVTFKLQN